MQGSLADSQGPDAHFSVPHLCSIHRERCPRTLDASLEHELGQERPLQPLLWGACQPSLPRPQHRGKGHSKGEGLPSSYTHAPVIDPDCRASRVTPAQQACRQGCLSAWCWVSLHKHTHLWVSVLVHVHILSWDKAKAPPSLLDQNGNNLWTRLLGCHHHHER